jgi:hypothetical protein
MKKYYSEKDIQEGTEMLRLANKLWPKDKVVHVDICFWDNSTWTLRFDTVNSMKSMSAPFQFMTIYGIPNIELASKIFLLSLKELDNHYNIKDCYWAE